MKKIMMLLIVGLLMLGVSGQAMAAFNEGDLIRVVYTGTGSGTEYLTDLGNFSSLTSYNPGSTSTLSTDPFSLSSVGASNWSNVSIGYFIMSTSANNGNGAAWTSGPAGGTTVNNGGFWAGMVGNATMVLQGAAFAAGSNSSVQWSQSNGSSYWTWMNNGGFGTGTMGGYLQSANGEANLAALSTTGYVDQVLYYYGSDPDTAASGAQVGVLRTYANCITVLNPVAPSVPIPAAAYLFGSGLIGLVGLRRKMAA